MNCVAMDGNHRANSNNGDGNNYIIDYCCSPSTIESFGSTSCRDGDRGGNNNVGDAAFPPTIPVAAIPNSNTGYATHNIHRVDSHPYSKPHTTTTTTTTPYHKNVRYVQSTKGASSPDQPRVQQSTKGAFDPASIVLEDLRIGPAASAVGTAGGTGPVLERRVSPTQYYDKRGTGGGIGGEGRSHNNNYHIRPSHHGSPQQWFANLNYRQRQLFQEEHQQHVAPVEKHNNTKKKPPPASSLQTLNQRHQDSQHCDRQHCSSELKPPPPSSPPLSKQPRQQTKKQDHLGVRNNNDRPSRPARIPSLPRTIDVDLSYSSNYLYNENDGSHPPPPTLSPISFSSSMFLKRAPIDNYYPSKDTIEKQLCDLPPIEAIFPTITAAPVPSVVPPASNTSSSSTRARARASKRPAVPDECGANVTTANATTNARHHQVVPDRTSRTAPSSEGNTTAVNTTAVFKNRPEKPLRINSQFPSQLQLQKQQQQERQQKQQQQQQQQQQHSSNLRNNQNAHLPPEDDTYNAQSPRPLPIGNGITNGIATGIDATTAASLRQRQRAFVPLTHYQEYDLQLSSPTTTTTSSTTRTTTAPQTPTNQHQQPQLQASKNTPSVIRNHRDESTTENDSSLSKSSLSPVVTVEIYPGVSQILRGAEETAKAAKRNFLEGCTCLICNAEYSCIANAAFVICPACFVVNPLEGPVAAKTSNNYNDTAGGSIEIGGRWGVGLGFVSDNDSRQKGEKYFSKR
jgi:hypothetical protein